jgi:HK97 family phage portal protein
MTPYTLKETLMGHVLLWGNAYAEIEFDTAGNVVALWPLRPSNMIRIDTTRNGELLYTYALPGSVSSQGAMLEGKASGGMVTFPQSSIFHLRGLSSNGIVGYSPITLHREALGLALAAEEYGARFFGNSAQPGGVLQTPNRLSERGAANLKASWEDAHRGVREAWRVAILEEGVEWKGVGLPPGDAQFIETRQYQLTEVSRIFRVPPHKISDLNRATYSNVDKQEQQFKGDSLEPWLVRFEEQATISLLSPAERQSLFLEYLMDAQWRADIRTRYEAYARGKQWGWLSTNDIREYENLNPIENGDDYWQPVNMMNVGDEPPATQSDVRAMLADAFAAAEAGDDTEDVLRTLEGRLDRLVIHEEEQTQLVASRTIRRRIERDREGRIIGLIEGPA